MKEGKEQLLIENCLVCGETHIYWLFLRRRMIVITGKSEELELAFGCPSEEITSLTTETTRQFTESFICPRLGKKFEHSFSLKDSNIAKIISLNVGKPILEKDLDKEDYSILDRLNRQFNTKLPIKKELLPYPIYFSENFGFTTDGKHITGIGIPKKSVKHKFNNKNELEIIGELKYLQHLFLPHHELKELPESLQDLKLLKILNLSYNSFETLPDWIGEMKNLKILSLSHNSILEIPSSLENLSELQTLHLSNNKLKVLPEWITRLKNLKILTIDTNAFTNLPETMANLTNLEELAIGNQDLEKIPEGVGDLTNLKSIQIWDVKQDSIPEDLGNLTNLESLGFWSCKDLESIPEWVQYLKNLIELRVNNSQVKEIQNWVGTLSKLKTFSINSSKLKKIPETIGNLEHLENLNFEDNQLKFLPSSIVNLRNLKTLFINYNEFVNIPENLCECTQLEYIVADHNPIKNIPQCIFHLPKLDENIENRLKTILTMSKYDKTERETEEEVRAHWEFKLEQEGRIEYIYAKVTCRCGNVLKDRKKLTMGDDGKPSSTIVVICEKCNKSHLSTILKTSQGLEQKSTMTTDMAKFDKFLADVSSNVLENTRDRSKKFPNEQKYNEQFAAELSANIVELTYRNDLLSFVQRMRELKNLAQDNLQNEKIQAYFARSLISLLRIRPPLSIKEIENIYEAVNQIFNMFPDNRIVINVKMSYISTLTVMYGRTRQFKKVEPYLKELKAFADKYQDETLVKNHLMATYSELAVCYMRAYNLQNARNCFQIEEEIAEKYPENDHIQTTHSMTVYNLISASLDQQNWNSFDEYSRKISILGKRYRQNIELQIVVSNGLRAYILVYSMLRDVKKANSALNHLREIAILHHYSDKIQAFFSEGLYYTSATFGIVGSLKEMKKLLEELRKLAHTNTTKETIQVAFLNALLGNSDNYATKGKKKEANKLRKEAIMVASRYPYNSEIQAIIARFRLH